MNAIGRGIRKHMPEALNEDVRGCGAIIMVIVHAGFWITIGFVLGRIV